MYGKLYRYALDNCVELIYAMGWTAFIIFAESQSDVIKEMTKNKFQWEKIKCFSCKYQKRKYAKYDNIFKITESPIFTGRPLQLSAAQQPSETSFQEPWQERY